MTSPRTLPSSEGLSRVLPSNSLTLWLWLRHSCTCDAGRGLQSPSLGRLGLPDLCGLRAQLAFHGCLQSLAGLRSHFPKCFCQTLTFLKPPPPHSRHTHSPQMTCLLVSRENWTPSHFPDAQVCPPTSLLSQSPPVPGFPLRPEWPAFPPPLDLRSGSFVHVFFSLLVVAWFPWRGLRLGPVAILALSCALCRSWHFYQSLVLTSLTPHSCFFPPSRGFLSCSRRAGSPSVMFPGLWSLASTISAVSTFCVSSLPDRQIRACHVCSPRAPISHPEPHSQKHTGRLHPTVSQQTLAFSLSGADLTAPLRPSRIFSLGEEPWGLAPPRLEPR